MTTITLNHEAGPQPIEVGAIIDNTQGQYNPPEAHAVAYTKLDAFFRAMFWDGLHTIVDEPDGTAPEAFWEDIYDLCQRISAKCPDGYTFGWRDDALGFWKDDDDECACEYGAYEDDDADEFDV